LPQKFISPLYSVTTSGGEKVTIDVTNSISSGLEANSGLIDHLIPWMDQRGYDRVLDFGAGALRHTIPLLKAGIQVTAVEYERAYQRPKANEHLQEARKYDGFTELIWPHAFLKSKIRYDVALLTFVLQVVPVRIDREIVLRAIGEHFAKNGPKRLFYASRFGEADALPKDTQYNDGWVRGKGENDRSFYTEWKAADTDKFFKSQNYERAGSYKGASQPYIYDYRPGVL
jgi:hypothetical protein